MVYVVSACVRACMLYCLCGGWQGLRTLELCVDNLQPEFLYNHIQPVRAELMQVTVMLCFFRLDALALSVIATATWLAGWLAGWVAGWLSVTAGIVSK